MKSSKNVQQELFTEKKNGETGTKRALDYLECLNYKKSLIAMRDSPFCKMFLPLFGFEQGRTLKNVSNKLYTIKIKEKKETETNSSAWDLKNA